MSRVRGQALRRGGGHRRYRQHEARASGGHRRSASRRRKARNRDTKEAVDTGVVERAASLIASSILQRSRKGGGAEDGEVQAEARAVDIGEVQAEGVKHNAAA